MINWLNLRGCANKNTMYRYRPTILAAILAAAAILSGCDSFRKLAGRPTSGEIELKRLQIEAKEAEIAALKTREKRLADSLAMMDSIVQAAGTVLNPSQLGGLYTTSLDFRYYIVVGSFRNRMNAEKLLLKTADAGYPSTLICFRNGLFAVGLSQTNRMEEAFASLKTIKNEPFCPPDVWILVNE